MANDWLPRREQDLLDLMKHWTEWLDDTAKQTAFGWDPAACTVVTDQITGFRTARAAYQDDDSTENRIARDNARKAAEGAMRTFATEAVRNNPKMKDEDKYYLGVRVADKISTPAPKPETWPVSHYDLNTPRQIGVTSRDSESGRKAMPQGVRWIEHTWMVIKPGDPLPSPLPNIKDFDQFETWTRPSKPCVLPFTENLRRGAIAHTSRWVNTHSNPGPWAPIELVTIP
ncbi:MAG: hypothetical protein LBT11_06305 [Treponema sp.]|jgi:hypothetical protein|nr:hypothetical protein [Treponema sp.]